MSNIRTYALAIAAACFITGSQASAQGGPNVTVVNTPLPVTVTNQAMPGTPVAFCLGNDTGNCTTNSYTVQTNKRLVIEYISGSCPSGDARPPSLFFSAVTSGVTNNFHTIASTFTFATNPANVFWRMGNLVKIYADPGTNVTFTVSLNTSCDITFSGLLLNP